MRRLTSPEPLEWVASELLKRVLSCFASDNEAFRFIEEWLKIGLLDAIGREHLSDAIAREILVRWINSAGIDTWEVPMPMQLGIRPKGFCCLEAMVLLLCLTRRGIGGFGEIHELC